MVFRKSTKTIDTKGYFNLIAITFLFLSGFLIFRVDALQAQSQTTSRISNQDRVHPFNIKLIQSGQLTVTKYFMNVPRITAEQAFALYKANRAVFVLNSYQDKDLIMGGYWTKQVHTKIDYNKLVKKDQILVFY